MERNYFIEGIFVLLGLVLIVTVIKYPKETLVKLPLGILYLVFIKPIKSILLLPAWIIGFPIVYFGRKYKWKITPSIEKLLEFGIDDNDRPLPSTKNLKIDFKTGDKYIFVISSNKDMRDVIEKLIDVFEGRYSIDDFKINSSNGQSVITFPRRISFYDFNLMVQHFNDEVGQKGSFGIYKSNKLQYFVFQDDKTSNNLVGFTSDKRLFSIYIFDEKQHLKLNQNLKVDTEWVERWNGTTANNTYVSLPG